MCIDIPRKAFYLLHFRGFLHCFSSMVGDGQGMWGNDGSMYVMCVVFHHHILLFFARPIDETQFIIR